MGNRADLWYKLAGKLEAYAEVHEAFLLEVGEHLAAVERLAMRLDTISNRDVIATQNGEPDVASALWQQCKQQIVAELSRHRLMLIQTVQNAALATDDVRRMGSTVIRPK